MGYWAIHWHFPPRAAGPNLDCCSIISWDLGNLGYHLKKNLEFPARVLSVSPCITYGHLPHLKAWRLASKPHLREDQLRAKRCGEKKYTKNERTHVVSILQQYAAMICSLHCRIHEDPCATCWGWQDWCYHFSTSPTDWCCAWRGRGTCRDCPCNGSLLNVYSIYIDAKCASCCTWPSGAVGRSIISIQFHNSSSHHRCKCADCQLPQLPADFVRSWWSPTFGSEPHWHGGICWQFPRWLQFRSASSKVTPTKFDQISGKERMDL